LIQTLVDGQGTRFALEHHRDAITHRQCQRIVLADQFGLVCSELERPFTKRTGQNIE